MFDTWNMHTFDRLPVVYEHLGFITYKIFLKKDIEGNYWLFTYSIKQPAFRYVGKFHKKYNDILDSGDIEAINKLLDDSGCYLSSYSSFDLEKVFEAFSSWVRNPIGKDRIRGVSISYASLDDYLIQYTKDEDVIKDITEGLGVFCT